MSRASFSANVDSPVPKSELAVLIARVLAESGPMVPKELKRAVDAAGQSRVLQATIKQALQNDLRGEVVRRGEAWGVVGDSRFDLAGAEANGRARTFHRLQ